MNNIANNMQEPTYKILSIARDEYALFLYAYKRKLYREAVKEAYDTFVLIGEALATNDGRIIRKRDCHLQISEFFKDNINILNINKEDIDLIEEIRPLRNQIVHCENHIEEIKDNEYYKQFADKGIVSLKRIMQKATEYINKNNSENI